MLGLGLGCLFFLVALAGGGYGAWSWVKARGGLPAIQLPAVGGSPSAPGSPPSTAAAQGGLEEAAGTWVVRPGDSNYDEDEPARNRLELTLQGGVLVGTPPGGGSEIRLVSRQGDDFQGEYVEDGAVTAFKGRLQGGRLTLTVEGESVTLVRPSEVGSAPPSSATPEVKPESPGDGEVAWGPGIDPDSIVFRDTGDLDGDGQDEVAAVVADKPGSDPQAEEPRRLAILKSDGSVAFETPSFKEPFRPDLDNLADRPENTAGVHVVQGAGAHPDIRLVFAPASGNFVVFRYDGSTYQVVESGD